MIALRVVDPEQWRVWRDLRLQALAESPHAFGSKLADWQGEGDTEHRWRARLAGVPYNLIAIANGVPAGMVSATAPGETGTIELISLWVAPFARGKAVGDALVRSVFAHALRLEANRVQLCVFKGNRQAVALYRRHGFVDVGQVRDDETGMMESQMSIDVTSRRFRLS